MSCVILLLMRDMVSFRKVLCGSLTLTHEALFLIPFLFNCPRCIVVLQSLRECVPWKTLQIRFILALQDASNMKKSEVIVIYRIDFDDIKDQYIEDAKEHDGDFRSPFVKRLRDEADIIVTNPPFSMFREFIDWIMEAYKKFLVIGNMNAITYKEIFPLIKENKMWIGATGFLNDMVFGVPEGTVVKETDRAKAARLGYVGNYTRLGNSCWYTNLEHGRRHQPLSLMTMSDNLRYSKHKELRGKAGYDHYDNYDAIEVPYTDAIPSDYDGVMGVPISFLGKYCPEQFEIVNANDYRKTLDVPVKAHGLIKDKEASIKTYKDSECKKKLQDNLAISNKTLRERERDEQPMHESVSNILLAPGADGWHVNGQRKYARIFIRFISRHGSKTDCSRN